MLEYVGGFGSFLAAKAGALDHRRDSATACKVRFCLSIQRNVCSDFLISTQQGERSMTSGLSASRVRAVLNVAALPAFESRGL